MAYYWRALAWFFGGMAVNAAYGVVQLVTAQAGVNLDSLFVSPLTGGASQINIYGAINGSDVYRPNALTGDPNHLGIMLIVPLLVLTPLYLRLEQGHRLRRKLGALIAFMIIVEIATLSRSGLLGIGVGVLVLLLPYRHYVRSRALIYPILGALAVVAVVIATRFHYFLVVLKSRVQTGARLAVGALPGLRFRAADPPQPPAARPRPEQLLDLLPGRHRQDELGPALVLRLADRRDRARRAPCSSRSSSSGCSCG